MATQKDIARTLLDVAGRTYAAEAGIRLANTPSPLYRLVRGDRLAAFSAGLIRVDVDGRLADRVRST